MKKFVHFSIGAFLLLAGISVLIMSIQPARGAGEKPVSHVDTAHHLNVVYVNIDTINAYYLPFVELSSKAGGDLETKMARYQQKSKDLEDRYALLQERVTMGTISTSDAEREEKAINSGIDELKIMEAELAVIEQQAMAKNDSISGIIAQYFDMYSKKNKIDYVLMYGTGMPLIYANDAFDITAIALSELNAAYKGKVKGAGAIGK